ncbi:hypothetical protein [Enterovibrio paralichthyis]|uniref:hypothetical protein n=1 Tax=Enterovibrio paralichthyis TaxID=2853805 RepID=UPI001C47EE2B|nr:hypothetical protein [Enterovibrio paralichthyis]MBV7300241.1 hypothetical protein [Enterovibrio paralichthyis]
MKIQTEDEYIEATTQRFNLSKGTSQEDMSRLQEIDTAIQVFESAFSEDVVKSAMVVIANRKVVNTDYAGEVVILLRELLAELNLKKLSCEYHPIFDALDDLKLNGWVSDKSTTNRSWGRSLSADGESISLSGATQIIFHQTRK